MKAIVTGGEGGLGRAFRARLEREGYQVESLDISTGFDVTDPAAWERVGPVDLACLNAGVLTGELGVESYRRAVAVNVDGVVLGVLRLREIMREGSIVATASLAGLTAMPSDPVYSLTKHAVVGFVRSMAPHLEPVAVAEALWRAATSGATGECWFVQPGREPAPFRFPSVPGPRVDGERVGTPPV